MQHLYALVIGFALDAALGDPHGLWHPVRAIGGLISGCEKLLRRVFPDTPAAQRLAGVVLVLVVATLPTAAAALLLWACGRISGWLALAVESVLCYQMLAARSLRDESMKVHDALEAGTIDEARYAVSMIVGRDTDQLDEQGIARAAVETVAENASDGVVAPLLYMALGGAVAGVLYKSINTMDSMVGYKNQQYRYFGTAAARLDDVANFVPARLCALAMCVVAPLAGLDGAGAWRVFKRDRGKHASPNSAQTEAACAGALGVRLAGPNRYFGTLVDKPYIGDDVRAIEASDIVRANRLTGMASLAVLALSVLVGLVVYWAGGLV